MAGKHLSSRRHGQIRSSCYLASLLAIVVAGQQGPLAMAATPNQTPSTAHTPVALNLGSSSANFTAGHLVAKGPVTIRVGSGSLVVNSTTPLTAAERLAVYQMVSTGHQSIQIGTQGAAVGGSFSIGPKFSQYVSSLVIPTGVTAIDKVSTNTALNLAGNFTNAGSFFAVSASNQASTFGLGANSIINQPGGLISTVLPAAGLPGVTSTPGQASIEI